MANEVYANGQEVACKAANGKSICAFPDVCFTPPLTPATPPGVPIPYPNTGMASDTTDGSKTVQVSGKEVMLKNKSYFKSSTGDEAGSAPKKGVVTSEIKGKVYFNAWSMDVKIEGENVVRNLDITTHNHASFPGNSPTWPYLDAAAFEGKGPCKDLAKKVKTACVGTEKKPKGFVKFTQPKKKKGKRAKPPKVKRSESMEAMCEDPKCKEAMKCVLSPYSPNNCCPEGGVTPTPHHVVPKSQFKTKFGKPSGLARSYKPKKAPCICVEGTSQTEGDHGELHEETSRLTRLAMTPPIGPGKTPSPEARWTYEEAEDVGAAAVKNILDCDPACTKEQLTKGHNSNGMKIKPDANIRPTTPGPADDEPDGVIP